jgi:hypothetical protein
MFIVYLSQGLLPVTAFFYPFEDDCFELCINWLCTSSDVEAGFNYPILKKILRTKLSAVKILHCTSSHVEK